MGFVTVFVFVFLHLALCIWTPTAKYIYMVRSVSHSRLASRTGVKGWKGGRQRVKSRRHYRHKQKRTSRRIPKPKRNVHVGGIPPSQQPMTVVSSRTQLDDMVKAMDTDRAAAVAQYGPMRRWDISQVKDLSDLFAWAPICFIMNPTLRMPRLILPVGMCLMQKI